MLTASQTCCAKSCELFSGQCVLRAAAGRGWMCLGVHDCGNDLEGGSFNGLLRLTVPGHRGGPVAAAAEARHGCVTRRYFYRLMFENFCGGPLIYVTSRIFDAH